MSTHWVSVRQGQIKHRSHPSITVQESLGAVLAEYIVTFPLNTIQPPASLGLTCLATLNADGGTISAIPGDECGHERNQVKVLTPLGTRDFSLAVFAA